MRDHLRAKSIQIHLMFKGNSRLSSKPNDSNSKGLVPNATIVKSMGSFLEDETRIQNDGEIEETINMSRIIQINNLKVGQKPTKEEYEKGSPPPTVKNSDNSHPLKQDTRKGSKVRAKWNIEKTI